MIIVSLSGVTLIPTERLLSTKVDSITDLVQIELHDYSQGYYPPFRFQEYLLDLIKNTIVGHLSVPIFRTP